jgi:hypothetical protein
MSVVDRAVEPLGAASRPGDLAAAVGRLVVGHDGEDYLLGRPDLGMYVVVPRPGAVLVEALQARQSLPVAAARASAAAGAPVDAEDFLAGLAAVGLLDPPHPGTGQRGREVR